MGSFFRRKGHVCPHIMSERGCARCGTSGFVTGTLVLNDSGWGPVEYLKIGDMIPTLEHGSQPIINIVQEPIWLDPGTCPSSILPLDIPAGALGNTIPFLLPIENAIALVGQPIDITGIANVSIEGIDMAEFSGIKFVQPPASTMITKLYFEGNEFINIAKGASILCRTEARPFALDPSRSAQPPSRIQRLNQEQADAFLLLLEGSGHLN